ncbi:hypothetical protein PZA22_16455 [Pectobacterium polaris]|uniref:hypothetical protein n=1 Tax=Pectobacterium polaris TaxID=2042057 RepID=UPI0023AF9A74|nr:hypothetical protein [Pectobacterium polaris]MDE8756078.1 hypothetical protein [Pectobacterium polaris]
MDLLTTINILEQLGHKKLWICTNTPACRISTSSTYYNMHNWNNPTINRKDGTVLAERVARPDEWELVSGHKNTGTRISSPPNPVWITPKRIREEIAEMERIEKEKIELAKIAQPKSSETDGGRL